MRRAGRSNWWRVAFLCVIMLVVAACGTGDDTGDTGDTTATTATSDTTGDTTPTTVVDDASTTTDGDDTERGTAADEFDRFNSMSGQERHDALLAAAQEEGAVVFYTTAPGWSPVVDAFEDTYDIEVELFQGRGDTILQRVTQEYEAGFYGVDVFEDEAAAILSLEVGITYPYINDELTSQIPGYDPELGLVPMRIAAPTIAWNTEMVDESEIPDTIVGFADPVWEGRLMVDDGGWPWYSAIHDYLSEEEGWSDEEIQEFFETLLSYSASTGNSIAMTELMIAQENPVGMAVLSQVVDRNAAVGAPITWRKSDGSFVEPLVIQPEGGVLMKNAPHPAAGLLLMDFILAEGQHILQEAGTFVPTAIPQPNGPLQDIPDELFQPVDNVKFYDEREEWSSRWDELVRGG